MSKSSKNTHDLSVHQTRTEETTQLVKDELIGRHVTITACTDPTWVGKTGIIIDETKNTFLIETQHTRKMIAKKTAIFKIEYHEKHVFMDGARIAYRPEDRIKKAR